PPRRHGVVIRGVRLWIRGRRGAVRVCGAPRDEVPILRERRLDQLIEDVVGRLVDECGVREQRLAIGFLQSRDVAEDAKAACAGFDQSHVFSCGRAETRARTVHSVTPSPGATPGLGWAGQGPTRRMGSLPGWG